ncbi:hypothetical protein WJX84_011130 [Apatococcus fuscideae]|uniref:homogentisate 1,2-dioxygenase n=1 Tax=Apatococcus fuscideae TaxID=2026836 RepID=A0AAW1SV71_9CHLO
MQGVRIDYALCSKGLLEQVTSCEVLGDLPPKWSDHAALMLELRDVPLVEAHKPCALSSARIKRFNDAAQRSVASLFGAKRPAAALPNPDPRKASRMGNAEAIRNEPSDASQSASRNNTAKSQPSQAAHVNTLGPSCTAEAKTESDPALKEGGIALEGQTAGATLEFVEGASKLDVPQGFDEEAKAARSIIEEAKTSARTPRQYSILYPNAYPIISPGLVQLQSDPTPLMASVTDTIKSKLEGLLKSESQPTTSSCWRGERLQYLSGFGNELASEAVQGALPLGQNNPRRCAFGLYAEQLSGTAFTAPKRDNQRSWLYRLRPSVGHESFEPYATPNETLLGDFSACVSTPNQLRWLPFPPKGDTDFVDSLYTVCGSGSASSKSGFAVHMYAATAPMEERCLTNADGDFLLVPQTGALGVVTEFGWMEVAPGEICVIQRGMRFAVHPTAKLASGYILEVFSGHFALPELGPIGANGLAAARHFMTPTARFEDRQCGSFTMIHKLDGRLWGARQGHSPFDVVAWHGNYAPYKYDLAKFCPMNAAAFDHPDPSIFTVLTCPSSLPGVAVADFVIFPPRWLVAQHTFRPPYFHRNCMSEFMGLIRGAYDGKKGGFLPGGASLHSCMSPHGVDVATFEAATAGDDEPQEVGGNALAFMFETDLVPRVTPHAMQAVNLDKSYQRCWQGFKAGQIESYA